MPFSSPHHGNEGQQPNSLEAENIPSPSINEVAHYEPKFKQVKEDLHNLFNIEVTSTVSLRYPWVIDELYTAARDELLKGTPWGFDYMIDEHLLTQEDIKKRGVTDDMRNKALDILKSLKGPRLTRAKGVFINGGILREEELSEEETQ